MQAVYLLAWLIMLRIDEAVSLEFGDIDFVPGERECIIS
jgi:integrase